ncbi:antibiotic biosynthesis monooxygenase [Actinopolymorpha pittospori]|uniref:Antibiotic biosynthesis monooxygenase n=1 Tax=Actinopolymorpha pittospori TaxID=648752 RepID=A0A927RHG9_9ACTN|nr:antibiotic biosynthesis monooxygenase [Actinopolymorpha pittospori]MBE1612195.1 hypothetical protein [Actinopolymorpha pittospori]
MTANRASWPDVDRPDAGSVLLAEADARETSPKAILDRVRREPSPPGLRSVALFRSIEDDTLVAYTQWAKDQADHAYVADLMGAGNLVEYRLHRSGVRDNSPAPGCVVLVTVDFDGSDPQRQQRWIDTVFDAMAGETQPAQGGISGHFHVSVDGTRVLNYAEWTDERAHREALERSGQGTVGSSLGWRRVQEFPGVISGGYRRFRLVGSVSATPVEGEVAEEVGGAEVLDSRRSGWPSMSAPTSRPMAGQGTCTRAGRRCSSPPAGDGRGGSGVRP